MALLNRASFFARRNSCRNRIIAAPATASTGDNLKVAAPSVKPGPEWLAKCTGFFGSITGGRAALNRGKFYIGFHKK